MEKRTFLTSAFNLVGGVSGLLSLGLLVWNGGNLWRQVQEHERRLGSIEVGGSNRLQVHEGLDNERINDLRVSRDDSNRRMLKLEDAILALAEIRGDVKTINTRLDTLDKGQGRIEVSIEEHKKVTAK